MEGDDDEEECGEGLGEGGELMGGSLWGYEVTLGEGGRGGIEDGRF